MYKLCIRTNIRIWILEKTSMIIQKNKQTSNPRQTLTSSHTSTTIIKSSFLRQTRPHSLKVTVSLWKRAGPQKENLLLYPFSHNHGSEKWVPPIVLSFQGSFPLNHDFFLEKGYTFREGIIFSFPLRSLRSRYKYNNKPLRWAVVYKRPKACKPRVCFSWCHGLAKMLFVLSLKGTPTWK